MERVDVKFGTTVEELDKVLNALATRLGWNLSHVYYVIDIDASTVNETVYAVSDREEGLPLHPSGPSAVKKLSR